MVSLYDLSNGTIFNDLEQPRLFDAEYLRKGTRYRHSFNSDTAAQKQHSALVTRTMQRFIHIRQVTLLNNGALWHFCTTHQRSGPQLIGVI